MYVAYRLEEQEIRDDNNPYTSETYAARYQKLDEACDWLTNIGINYSTTRVGRYRRIFAALAQYQGATIGEFFKKYKLTDFVNAAHETDQIVRVYEGLHHSKDPDLTARLKAAVRGHDLFVLDTEDRSGRDFMFELTVAAKFARHGYKINFGASADVDVVVDGVPLFVECKRPKSKGSVQRNIKKGLKQLVDRYDASPAPEAARGIVALSVGKVLNPNLGLLEGITPKEVSELAARHNDLILYKHQKHWQSGQDKRTLGALLILDTPGRITSENKLVTIHEVILNNSLPIASEDKQFLENISNKVFVRKPDDGT
jgi:hypothetical protein